MANPKQLMQRSQAVLAKVEQRVKSISHPTPGYQRTNMSPGYTRYRVKGTRPKSDRGVTFHFKHSYITKGKHISQSYEDQTPAAKYQAYIERPGAVEKSEGWEPVLGEPTPGQDGNSSIAKKPKNDEVAPENMVAPETLLLSNGLSFGTIAEKRKDRKSFWRSVEENEGRRGRVQCRMIIELPHETNSETRFRIARDFCRILEEKNLPYWAAVHAPNENNDARNYHLHIAYYDRPARKSPDLGWDFSVKRSVKGKDRKTRIIHPLKQDKDRSAQGRNWITELRRRYADVANFHLAISGIDKRYDPRSYRESGILKEPTLHLGTKVAIAEKYGVGTKPGDENTRREIAYRLGRINQEEMRNAQLRDVVSSKILSTISSDSKEKINLDIIQKELDKHAESSKLRAESIRRAEYFRIAGEAATLRLRQRMAFLENEKKRLSRRSNDAAQTVTKRLLEEQKIVGTVSGELERFAENCTMEAKKSVSVAIKAGEDATKSINLVKKITVQNTRDLNGKKENPMEERALQAMLGKTPERKSISSIAADAVYVQENTPEEKNKILEKLTDLPNKTLREKAKATRDSADLDDNVERKIGYRQGYQLCKEAARIRGLDLETGFQTPEKASDVQQAIRHRDNALTDEEQQRIRDLEKSKKMQSVQGER